MDQHARSLLERLNTSASPKASKTSIPEPKTSVSPPAAEAKDFEDFKSISPAPNVASQTRSSPRASPHGNEAAMSIKDLLVSARHRSRETSAENDANLSDPATTMNSAGAANGSAPKDLDKGFTTTPGKAEQKLVINTSDGDSSGVAEEMPTTPGGSNNSSLASSGVASHDAPGISSLNRPQGVRMSCDGPSLFILPTTHAHMPRLQTITDDNGNTYTGEGIEQIANISRAFGHHDRDVIGATTKYIVYALKDGRLRIIDQNTGTRALAETPSTASVISLSVKDGDNSDESYILVLDAAHDLTVWSIKPWKVDSANVPLDYLIRIRTAGRKVDQSFPPIAKWWPRYPNCLAVCKGLAVYIYVFSDAQAGQTINMSGDREEHAISIPVDTGVRDFCFPDDGSALAILDFHGDVLLWPLCSDPAFSEFYDTSRLKAKLSLGSPAIKFTLPMDLNPCSIQFLDLDNETDKPQSTPLLLVGSSNNRRLHLIDISSGTILQEMRLPSFNNEALPCQDFSMVYTKEKQFLVLADNLSNSIYFLHLYSPMEPSSTFVSQSDFLSYIASTNCTKSLYSTGNTPIFDYITELPFFQSRKLQALVATPSLDAYLDIFTAHSEGFTMLSPEKEDILPDNYSEAKPVHAEYLQKPKLHREVGYAVHKTEEKSSKSPRSLSRASSVESLRSNRESKTTPVKKEFVQDLREDVRSDDTQTVANELSTIDNGAFVVAVTKPVKASRSASPVAQKESTQNNDLTNPVSSNMDIEGIFNRALEQQYERLLADQKLLTSAADDRHESILKVVSSTLTTNVGKLLEQTVRTSIEKSILPAISTIVKKSIDQQVTKALIEPLQKSIPKELRSSVNDGINKALLDKDGEVKFLDTLSQMMVTSLEPLVTRELSTHLGATVDKSLGMMVGKMEERLQSTIDKSLQRIQKENRTSHQETNKKLDALSQTLAAITQQLKENGVQSVSRSSSPLSTAVSPLTRLSQQMADQFRAGNYSDGIETWSDAVDSDQAALFDVLLDYEPSILRDVEQLSLMSAANAISVELKTRVEKRLQWLEMIISLAKLEGNYSEYWPRVLGLLDQRLELAFEDISSKDRKSPLARKIAVTQYYTQGKLAEFKP